MIYNRLADGEPLGIDATLRYEVGFDEPLTESELAGRTRPTTPRQPGPAADPDRQPRPRLAEGRRRTPPTSTTSTTSFKPGTCGEHTFTADYDEFLQPSDEYQAALEAEGGQPDDC